VQEAIDLTYAAFTLAEKYRSIVVILADGNIGQLMEPAELPPMLPVPTERPAWAVTGALGRPHNVIASIHLKPEEEEAHNRKLQNKLAAVRRSEVRYQEYWTTDADYLVVAFGTAGRVAHTAVKLARAKGIKVGLLRPISLYPFPERHLAELAGQMRGLLVVEMNAGQMVEDVRRIAAGRAPVAFFGRMGGVVPMPDEILAAIQALPMAALQTDGPRHISV
jgi:2-oxoglutarate ferredoxin oxidoreductase subunit alpha